MAKTGVYVDPKPGQVITCMDANDLDEILDCLMFSYENEDLTEKERGFNRHLARRLKTKLDLAIHKASQLADEE